MLCPGGALAAPWNRNANDPRAPEVRYRAMTEAIVEEMKKYDLELASVLFGRTKVFYRGNQDRFFEV